MPLIRVTPANRGELEPRIAAGELSRILPGVVVAARDATDPRWRLGAIAWRYPGAVVTDAGAAYLTVRPSVEPSTITIAGARARAAPDWLRCEQRRIPADQVARSTLQLGRTSVTIHHTSRELTALDLIRAEGIEAGIEAVRAWHLSHESLVRVLREDRRRAGNVRVAEVLDLLATNAWSVAEVRAHQVLGGLPGWRANVEVLHGGRAYIVDIAFVRQRLAIEIDGWASHSDRGAFESDRARQNDLVAAGWTVVRFTWRQLEDEPERCLAMVRGLLTRLNRTLSA